MGEKEMEKKQLGELKKEAVKKFVVRGEYPIAREKIDPYSRNPLRAEEGEKESKFQEKEEEICLTYSLLPKSTPSKKTILQLPTTPHDNPLSSNPTHKKTHPSFLTLNLVASYVIFISFCLCMLQCK